MKPRSAGHLHVGKRMAPVKTSSIADREAADLVVGALIAKVVVGANLTLIVGAALVWQSSFKTVAHEILTWIVLTETLLLVLVFMPVLMFRKVFRRESTKLAAARAITWFRDALASL